MERMLLEVVPIISSDDNTIFSAEQKQNMEMPCFMQREI
jgi:hypothetical protein